VGAGQKVIIWTSVEYDATTNGVNAINVVQTIQEGASVFDTATQTTLTPPFDGITPSAWGLARVIEITPAAGAHVYTINASQSLLTPQVNAVNLSMVVMVVSA
jgi:hypothetical protein